MRKRFPVGLLAAALLCLAPPTTRADVWDLGTDNDNVSGSDNELTHGLDQVHDLAAQAGGTIEDVDWYRFQIPYATSWEILLDGITGDVSNGGASPALELIGPDGTTVDAVGTPLTSFGVARRLTTYPGSIPDYTSFVRVGAPVCALACTADDRYRIRVYETTLVVPRYNNGNGQVTALVLQNNTPVAVSGIAYAYGAAGVALGSFSFVTQPYEVKTINLATIDAGLLNNTAGGLRLAHSAPYGQLTGKAVALEPATECRRMSAQPGGRGWPTTRAGKRRVRRTTAPPAVVAGCGRRSWAPTTASSPRPR
jgi:hypothetical protein